MNIGMKEAKQPYLQMILFTQKIPENLHTRINEFSKIAGYKVNTQKSTVFLHASCKQLESNFFKKLHIQQNQKYKLPKNKYNKRPLY